VSRSCTRTMRCAASEHRSRCGTPSAPRAQGQGGDGARVPAGLRARAGRVRPPPGCPAGGSGARAASPDGCMGSSRLRALLSPVHAPGRRRCRQVTPRGRDPRLARRRTRRRGRCLPYGEGITYWPVVEVVKQLSEVTREPDVAETIEAVAGDREVATSSEEIAWAFRKLVEPVATHAPLVCVFDDVHWGEETFLDLVEHVADLSRDAPILLLCMARPDCSTAVPAGPAGRSTRPTSCWSRLAPTRRNA
jgi:hypothetical protein